MQTAKKDQTNHKYKIFSRYLKDEYNIFSLVDDGIPSKHQHQTTNTEESTKHLQNRKKIKKHTVLNITSVLLMFDYSFNTPLPKR